MVKKNPQISNHHFYGEDMHQYKGPFNVFLLHDIALYCDN